MTQQSVGRLVRKRWAPAGLGFVCMLGLLTPGAATASSGTPQSAPQGRSGATVQTQATGQVAKRAMPNLLRPAPVVIEIESLLPKILASAGVPIRQEMAAFGPGWGGNAQVFWRPPAPVNTPIRNWPNARFSIAVTQPGTYATTLVYTQGPDYGDTRVFVRGTPRADLSGYAPTVRTARASLGDLQLTSAVNEVVVTVFRKNPASTDFVVGLDRLELQRK